MAAYPAASKVEMDRSLDSLLATDDPDAVAVRRVRETLGDHPIVMLVYADDDLATVDGLERNRRLTEAVAKTPNVAGVLSTSVLESLVARMRPLGSKPALFQSSDKLARGFDRMFAGYTHSAEHHYAAVVAILRTPDDVVDRDEMIAPVEVTVSRLRSNLATWQTMVPVGSRLSLVGEPVLIEDAFDLIQNDGRLMAAWILVLLTSVIVISLWDFRPAVVAVLVITLSILFTRAAMTWMDIPLSLVSSILSAIVTIIAVTSTLHLGVATVRARRQMQPCQSPVEAVIAGIVTTSRPIFWTCATTAAGFVALTVSRIVPVAQFGWIVAIGAIAVPISLMLIAPAIFCIRPLGRFFGTESKPPRPQLVETPLQRLCKWLASVSVSHRKKLAVASVVATMLAAAGLGRTEIESNFLKNFREDSSIATAYDEVETKLGGAGVWDVIVPIPQQIDRETISSIRDLQTKLRAITFEGQPALTKVLSLADADLVAKEAPLMRYVSPETRLGLMQSAIPVFYQTLITNPMPTEDRSVGDSSNSGSAISGSAISDPVNSDPVNGDSIDPAPAKSSKPRYFRIMLRSNENASTDQKRQTIAAVRQTIASHDFAAITSRIASADGSAAEVRPSAAAYTTGYYVILTRLVSSILADQYRCLAASTLLIALLLLIALRDVRRVIAALAINLMPIVWILGTSGHFQGKMNMGAAMIAAVSIGLSIDGSVHYLLGLPKRGSSKRQSANAAAQTGVPIVLATIALIIGFGTLTTSEFLPTATFGFLLAWTLAAATLANLTLLPAAITTKFDCDNSLPNPLDE